MSLLKFIPDSGQNTLDAVQMRLQALEQQSGMDGQLDVPLQMQQIVAQPSYSVPESFTHVDRILIWLSMSTYNTGCVRSMRRRFI